MASRALKTVENELAEIDSKRNIAQRIAAVMGEVDYVQKAIDFARFFENVAVTTDSRQCWEWRNNPSCVNTRHLELGTVADNKRDEIERGRFPDRKGEKHPSSLLTEEQVRDIRRRVSCGERHHVIAAEYGVSRQHIGKIVNLETWGHLA